MQLYLYATDDLAAIMAEWHDDEADTVCLGSGILVPARYV